MPAFRSISSILLFTVTPSAHACQLCSVTMSYNALRFTAIWFYLYFIWLAATAIAASRNPKTVFKFHPFQSALTFLIILLGLAFLMGVHLFALLLLPVLMLPTALRKQEAPKWLTQTARVILLIMAFSIPVSYYCLPAVINEPNTRSMATQSKRNLHFHEESIKGTYIFEKKLPGSLSKEPRYFSGNDLFGFEVTGSPLADIAMLITYPSSFVESETTAPLGYVRNGDRAWVISRGPDQKFNMPIDRIDDLSRNELTDFSYDPTNGIFSPGDIFIKVAP